MQKIALLFLTRDNLNQPEMWEEWLEGYRHYFSIYVHAKHPERVSDSLLRGCLISEWIDTAWGGFSLVEATLVLLREALQNQSNVKFVLLSESCVPIKSVAEVIEKLLGDHRVYLFWRSYREMWEANMLIQASRFLSAKRIPLRDWRGQDQWMILNRQLGELILDYEDQGAFENVFASDECYFATVLKMAGIDFDLNVHSMRSTDVDWIGPEEGTGRVVPRVYELISLGELQRLRSSESFFARKFTKRSDIQTFGLHKGE